MVPGLPLHQKQLCLTLNPSVQTPAKDPVSVPVVSCVNVSSDSCILRCSLNQSRSEQTTLNWFRGDQTVDSSSTSTVLNLTVQRRDYTDQYKCVALNPADKKTVIVSVTTVCKLNETETDTSPRGNTSSVIYAEVKHRKKDSHQPNVSTPSFAPELITVYDEVKAEPRVNGEGFCSSVQDQTTETRSTDLGQVMELLSTLKIVTVTRFPAFFAIRI
ncbi:hypothetical protein WMY93_005427 [Mugilogobius chulae]|uniref:Ig-like domain-containing protein n=1 Tax=Mugilogobius chulae TaxID=88201 RepID=A0AAW0PH27_9GOBI